MLRHVQDSCATKTARHRRLGVVLTSATVASASQPSRGLGALAICRAIPPAIWASRSSNTASYTPQFLERSRAAGLGPRQLHNRFGDVLGRLKG